MNTKVFNPNWKEPHTLYCTHLPCKRCVEKIVASPIKITKIVYLKRYREDDSPERFDQLMEGGIDIERYKEDDCGDSQS